MGKVVVDANVFIHGRSGIGGNMIVTIPEVLEELKSRDARNKAENMDLVLEEPPQSSVDRVKEAAEKIKSPTSVTDEKLVALAMEKDMELISDDKAVQNLCLHLGVDFRGFMDERIEEKVRWEKVCSNCGNKTDGKCNSCGATSSRRKQVRCSSE